VRWLGVASSKFYDWRERYGKVNEHNASIPRDHWLDESERQAIIDFHSRNPLEGYRRLTFMMLDQDVAAASPSSVYRVLKQAGLLDRRNVEPSKKGTGFVQPLRAHDHWHIDIAFLNLGGTFYGLCSVLDGYSRSIVHWEIRANMTELDVKRSFSGRGRGSPTRVRASSATMGRSSSPRISRSSFASAA
jgi:putative transposase